MRDRVICVLLEHQIVPAYFDVNMRAWYAKCVQVGRSVSVWVDVGVHLKGEEGLPKAGIVTSASY